MQNLTQKIVEYTEYLKSLDLQVSMHFLPVIVKKFPYKTWQNLLKYNVHAHPYCIKVKSCGNSEKCIAHQRALISSQPFVHGCKSCYAGVLDFVYPITQRGQAVGYVAVSGYKGNGEVVDITLFSTLRENIEEDKLKVIIAPICVMLENLISACEKAEESECNMMLQYLAENHTDITLSSFCDYFARSKSYVSHTFKNRFGVSFSTYCNNLKLADAKNLLLVTDFSITEIAINVGFNDSSYFVQLFKQKYGVSPLQFRKKNNA